MIARRDHGADAIEARRQPSSDFRPKQPSDARIVDAPEKDKLQGVGRDECSETVELFNHHIAVSENVPVLVDVLRGGVVADGGLV